MGVCFVSDAKINEDKDDMSGRWNIEKGRSLHKPHKDPSSKGKDKALSRLKCTVQVRRESFYHLTGYATY